MTSSFTEWVSCWKEGDNVCCAQGFFGQEAAKRAHQFAMENVKARPIELFSTWFWSPKWWRQMKAQYLLRPKEVQIFDSYEDERIRSGIRNWN